MNENTNKYSYSNIVKELDDKYHSDFRKFTVEDYQNLQQNIVRFKTGDAEASNYIVSVFYQFIKKYADFICGIYGDNFVEVKRDKSLNRFINLYISKDEKAKCTTPEERNILFRNTCNKIRSLFSKFEYLDIYNELICVLLNMANKYKITKPGDLYHKDNGTFHMYVNKCFHFDVFNTLKKIIGDPLAHLEFYSIEDDVISNEECTYGLTEDSNASMQDYINKTIILKDTTTDRMIEQMIERTERINKINNTNKLVLKEKENVDPYEVESLNFNWTNGITCGDEFQSLSSYEREILVLSYIQNKTDSEIADIYGCHRITIIKHRKVAVQKVQDYLIRKEV